MSDPDTEAEAIPPERQVRAWQRMAWPLRVVLYGVALLGLVGLIAWTQREDIARNLIGNELERQGIRRATTSNRSVSAGRRCAIWCWAIPKRPDATIERLSIDIGGGLFGLSIDSVIVEGLRGYGRLENGRVSFGTLDKLIYTDSQEPFSLPRLDLTLRDARLRIESPYGTLGVKAEGSGNLRDGFKGTLAAIGDGLRTRVHARPAQPVRRDQHRQPAPGVQRAAALCRAGVRGRGCRDRARRSRCAPAPMSRSTGSRARWFLPAARSGRPSSAASGLGGRAFVARAAVRCDYRSGAAHAGGIGVGFRPARGKRQGGAAPCGAQPGYSFEGDVAVKV